MFSKKRRSIKSKQRENPHWVLLKQIIIGLTLFAFVIGLVYLVWFISHIESLTIKEVSVTGGETISHQQIKRLVEEELEGDFFRLVPKAFSWTYPKENIISTISALPRIKDITVNREGGQKLIINFSEYQPYALWCDSKNQDQCVFLDESGFAFSNAPALKGNSLLRYSEADRTPLENEQAFFADFIRDTKKFVEQAEKLGFLVKEIRKTEVDEIEYHLSGGSLIKVSLRQSVEETLENLQALLSSNEFSELKLGSFHYIDLRYGNRVFVKESFESVDINETTAASSSEAAADF